VLEHGGGYEGVARNVSRRATAAANGIRPTTIRDMTAYNAQAQQAMNVNVLFILNMVI
jgi:hypothetical protein